MRLACSAIATTVRYLLSVCSACIGCVIAGFRFHAAAGTLDSMQVHPDIDCSYHTALMYLNIDVGVSKFGTFADC